MNEKWLSRKGFLHAVFDCTDFARLGDSTGKLLFFPENFGLGSALRLKPLLRHRLFNLKPLHSFGRLKREQPWTSR
jgi:hypothetical protein